MKTRRKNIKTPAKGRRSSIVCVRNSPIRRNPPRSTRNFKKPVLPRYESPLKSLAFYSLTNSPSTSTLKEEAVKEDKNSKQESIFNISESDTTNSVKIESLKNETIGEETDGDNQRSLNEDRKMEVKKPQTKLPKRKKKNIFTAFRTGETPKAKKRKLNKSPLSRFRDESVILLDDTQTSIEESQTEQVKKEDVVVIDCDDSLLEEMEKFHKIFNQSADSKKNLALMDSIIVLDPDDELPKVPVQNVCQKTSPKSNAMVKPIEDCQVIWTNCLKPDNSTPSDQYSSLNIPSTSSNITYRSRYCNMQSQIQNGNSYGNSSLMQRTEYNIDKLLKMDKINLDTRADVSNLKFLNNENNKPVRNKLVANYRSPPSVKSKNLAANGKKNNSGELIFAGEAKKSGQSTTKQKGLREIVIDGNNVAMAYTHNKHFSEKGIKMLIDYFTKKGHTVKVFIPAYRRNRENTLLEKWFNDGIVAYTPSRRLGNKQITSYDDRYILEYATACNGIVVSQDQFRDLYPEKPEYRDIIEKRLLVPTFVGDYVMFPEDPLGRNGPNLKDFLRHT